MGHLGFALNGPEMAKLQWAIYLGTYMGLLIWPIDGLPQVALITPTINGPLL